MWSVLSPSSSRPLLLKGQSARYSLLTIRQSRCASGSFYLIRLSRRKFIIIYQLQNVHRTKLGKLNSLHHLSRMYRYDNSNPYRCRYSFACEVLYRSRLRAYTPCVIAYQRRSPFLRYIHFFFVCAPSDREHLGAMSMISNPACV